MYNNAILLRAALYFPFQLHLLVLPVFNPRCSTANHNPSNRFKIEDSRYSQDTLAAWACIRLDRLQQGYRFVHLLDAKGQATGGLLLVKIEKSVQSWK